jgi:hypothetical protein
MSEHSVPEGKPEGGFNLLDKFPDLKPVAKAPSLGTVNGVGTMMMGSRDLDEETGTYVKTRCFTFLFVPLVALGAYRVFDAPGGGWYFLGKVPLSDFARNWNRLLALIVFVAAGVGAWAAYNNTPEQKAARELARADALAAEGKGKEAAEAYRAVMLGKTKKSAQARERFDALVAEPPGDLADTAGVYAVALELHRREQHAVKDLFGRALALAQKGEEADPAGALALVEAVAPLATRPADQLAPRRRLLERLAQQKPDDVDVASRLAAVCEEQGDLKRCREVLAPHEANLGDRDGAAILGRIYAHEGKYEPAYRLLSAYLDARLPRLRAAEQRYQDAITGLERRVVQELSEGKAKDFDFAKARAATQAEQAQMRLEYFFRQMRDDPATREAQRQLAAQAGVVSAALELGIVRLQRAQGMADPEQRRKELKKAEETFLSVQESVRGRGGQEDTFRVQLGRVYYWLGKPAEGKKLLDEFLKKHNRAGDMLVLVARMLREVGAVSEARKLCEEAFEKGADARKKQQAALVRSLMFTDLDDKLLWLGRCDPSNSEVKTSLCSARATKAMEDGKDDEAIRELREALAIYAKLPERGDFLNNCALVHFSLYQLTHEPEQFQRGADKLDRAIALQPDDSIVLSNGAAMLMEAAVRDIIGDALDWKVLKSRADLDLLPYLYRDQAGWNRFLARLKSHPGLAKARGYHEKLLVLAPRRPESYAALAGLYDHLHDLGGLESLWKRLQAADLDQEHSRREMLDFYAGKKEDKKREDLKKALALQRRTLEAARKVGGATLAVAAARMSSLRAGAGLFGLPADPAEVLRLAEEAEAAAASSATRRGRINALCFRAHQALAREDKAYAELVGKTRRSLGFQALTWALSKPGPLCDRALANADVQEAVKLTLEQVKAFPKGQGAFTWALLRVARPAEAEKLAARLKADERGRLRRSIDRVLSPLAATVALESSWALEAAGKPDEAAAVLREAAKKGVPLP